MRVAFLADSHFAKGPFFESNKRIHAWIALDATERNADLLIHGGDMFDDNPSIWVVGAAIEFLLDVGASMPILVVRGNHDTPQDLEIVASAPTDHPIIVEQAVGVHEVATKAGVARVLAVSSGCSLRKPDSHYGKIRKLSRSDPTDVLITVGHLLVEGVVSPIGFPTQDLRPSGTEQVDLKELSLTQADVTLLGHVHAKEEWVERGMPILYAGCPVLRACSSCRDDPQGYVLVDVKPGLVEWTRIEVPNTIARRQ